jgi:hypothetical protein
MQLIKKPHGAFFKLPMSKFSVVSQFEQTETLPNFLFLWVLFRLLLDVVAILVQLLVERFLVCFS